MDGTSPLLEVLAASELPVPAQRALAERAPHLAARVPNLDPVALLVEACGASEVAWRTAVAFAQDQATLGFGELAALVEVACAPPVEK